MLQFMKLSVAVSEFCPRIFLSLRWVKVGAMNVKTCTKCIYVQHLVSSLPFSSSSFEYITSPQHTSLPVSYLNEQLPDPQFPS